MQPDPGPHLGPLGFPAGLVDRSETLEPLGRRRERAQARRREILVVLGREDREYSIAREFQDLALVLLYGDTIASK